MAYENTLSFNGRHAQNILNRENSIKHCYSIIYNK